MQTKRYDLFFVCVCLALCAVLWLGMLIAGPAQARANEVLTAKPVLRSAEGWNARYLSDLADYVADRFFLRQTLVTAHNRLLTALGGGEAAGVIAGRDGWLYYAATLDDYTGADALSDAELAAAARNLALMQEYCNARGVRFLFVPTPNKNSLYDAAMPSYGERIFDGFDANRNVKEYDGIVGDIQKWFYGSLVKDSWCATSMCYFANKAGCLDAIGGKHDNVYDLMNACMVADAKGYGKFYDKAHLPHRIPQYAILFWLWSGTTMTAGSRKHVGMAEFASSGDTIFCIGGNQSDKICTKAYSRDNLYAIYCLK